MSGLDWFVGDLPCNRRIVATLLDLLLQSPLGGVVAYVGTFGCAAGQLRFGLVDSTDPTVTAPANITVEGDTTGGAAATNAAISVPLGG